jgi:hypothetical protein
LSRHSGFHTSDICPLKVNVILLHLVVMKISNTIRTDTTDPNIKFQIDTKKIYYNEKLNATMHTFI